MIEFARTHIISRSAGHSAIAAAAYRSGTDMYDDRTGSHHRYSVRADEVAHSEVMLPTGSPEYLENRAELWAAAELAEDSSTRRATAQIAKDHIIALPRELPLESQIKMAQEFAKTEFVDQGVAVDINVHLHSKDNPHAHLMTTTRTIDEYGFGKKARHLNGGFNGGKKVPEAEQIRHRWVSFQNAWCEKRGIDLSTTNNNGEWQATKHIGRKVEKHTKHEIPELVKETEELTKQRQKQILNNPMLLADRITQRKAVFTRKDMQIELFKHITDKSMFEKGTAALDKLLNIKDGGIVQIGQVEDDMHYTSSVNLQREIELTKFSKSMMKNTSRFQCDDKARERIIANSFSFFSDEQKDAVKHIARNNRLAVVVGLAGAGKSTMLKAANRLWKTQGLNVHGVALAGIAARGLQEGSDIESRTLASWKYALDNGKMKLDNRSVVVMDEAGMVDTKTMLETVKKIQAAGAKLILVGDPEQLQAINAGGPLRSMMQSSGFCEIGIVRRQNEAWQRQATTDLANGKTAEALEAYSNNGNVHWQSHKQDSIQQLADDTVQDLLLNKSTAVLAHTNDNVDELNSIIRQQLIDHKHISDKGESFISARGKIQLVKGDRVLFRKNDTRIGVQNGSVGTIQKISGGNLSVKLDGGELVKFSAAEYDSLSHGYAITVHKSQGVTVNHTRVLIGKTFNKHLSYVALSRHRKSTDIYATTSDFIKKGKGSNNNFTDNFYKILSREQIQENAIDFANRHGLEVSSDGRSFQNDQSLPAKAMQAKRTLLQETNKQYREMIEPIIQREHKLIDDVTDFSNQVIVAERLASSGVKNVAPMNPLLVKLQNAQDALKAHRHNRVKADGFNHSTWRRATTMAENNHPKLLETIKTAEKQKQSKPIQTRTR